MKKNIKNTLFICCMCVCMQCVCLLASFFLSLPRTAVVATRLVVDRVCACVLCLKGWVNADCFSAAHTRTYRTCRCRWRIWWRMCTVLEVYIFRESVSARSPTTTTAVISASSRVLRCVLLRIFFALHFCWHCRDPLMHYKKEGVIIIIIIIICAFGIFFVSK